MGSPPQRDKAYPGGGVLARPEYPTPPPSFSTAFPPRSPNAFYNEAPYAFFSSPYTTPVNVSYPVMEPLAQTPTPDLSQAPSPLGIGNEFNMLAIEDPNDVVSVSTAFHPGIVPTPDSTLSSSDGVLFYVHSPTLIQACPELFSSYLRHPFSNARFRQQVISLDTPSQALNVILHALYNMSPESNRPDIDTLILAVDHMPLYSVTPDRVLRPTSALYNLILSAAPLRPLDVYSLGAYHSIHSLAVAASSHLLAYDLSTISDTVAERMGALYLKKLMLLHVGRFDALKDILLHPPHPHPPSKACTFMDQKSLTRAWALVTAHLVWDARPDISINSMQNTLQPLTENLTCEHCHKALDERIKSVVVRWASVKNTALPLP